MFRSQPLPGEGKEFGCLIKAGTQRRIRDRISLVVIDVTLLAKCVEYDHGLIRQPHGFWQSLYGGLVASWLAGRCAVAVGPQSDQRALQDRFVRGIKTIVMAKRQQLGIRQVALGGMQQLGNAALIRSLAYQLVDRQ